MTNPYVIKYIAKEDPCVLAKYIQPFDVIIIVLPLYVHAMPGIVMKFIEQLEPFTQAGTSIGFILQFGFPESSQADYIEPYFNSLAKQLNCNYLGTVLKGEAAGIYMMPHFVTKKIFKQLNALGRNYNQTYTFDKEIMEALKTPYVLKKSTIKYFNFMSKLGVTNIFWNGALKKNNALDQRYDKPFLS